MDNYPSTPAMKAAVELEIYSALGRVQTVAIGQMIQKVIDATIEDCAKIADDFAAYEQTVIDRAHADSALSDGGRKNILVSAGSRQVAAEQIAHDVRALHKSPQESSSD